MRPPRIGNRLQQALARASDSFFAEHDAGIEPEPVWYPEYADRPVEFFQDKLRRRLWVGDGTVPGQRAIAESLVKHDRVVAATATGIGKTWLAGGLILWWLTTRKNSKVIGLSKTWQQVETQLFAGVRAAHAQAKKYDPSFPGRCLRTRVEIGPTWGAFGVSPKDPQNVAGNHAELPISDEAFANYDRWMEMSDDEYFATPEGEAPAEAPLFVVNDEGSGPADEVFDAVDGILTGLGCKQLILGNLVKSSGRMFDLWSKSPPTTKNRVCFPEEQEPEDVPLPPPPSTPDDDGVENDEVDAAHTHTMRITAFDVPGAIMARKFINRMRKDCGPNYMRNPRYMVRVLALPPLGGENAMFPLSLLEECAELRPGTGGTHMGVDLNFGGGDWSKAALEIDGRLRSMYAWQVGTFGLDNYDAAEIIYKLAKGWGVLAKNTHYDSTGAGRVVGDILSRRFSFHADGVNFSAKPVGDWRARLGWPAEGLKNRRAELHWNALRRFQEGLLSVPHVPEFEKALAQLSAIQYPANGSATWAPEKKTVYVAREGLSPDDAEAVLLAGARTDGTGPKLTTITPRRKAPHRPRKFPTPVDPNARAI